jgi:hypothetical protein
MVISEDKDPDPVPDVLICNTDTGIDHCTGTGAGKNIRCPRVVW